MDRNSSDAHDSSIFHDHNSEGGWQVIGYGPPSNFKPNIPTEFFVSGPGGTVHAVSATGTRTLIDKPDQNKWTTLKFFLPVGHWAVIEESGALPIRADSLEEWKAKRAMELVQQASELKGDPLKVIEMLNGAATLRGVDLTHLVKKLKSQCADEDEDLESVYRRVRTQVQNNPTGGQTF